MEARTGKEQAQSARPRFDPDQRARIRDTLIAYMERSAIGVPTLQKEIAIANDVVLDRIPLSTLQRFLSNSHRTNDSFIGFCDALARKLPVADPVAELARALGVMFPGEAGPGMPSKALAPGTNLTCAFTTGRPKPRLPPPKADASERTVEYSVLSRLAVVGATDGQAVRLREVVLNWRTEPDTNDFPAPEDAIGRPMEGAAVIRGDRMFVLLKNQITGTPRSYWSFPIRGTTILADLIEMPVGLAPDERPRALDTRRVFFLPDPEAAPDYAGP